MTIDIRLLKETDTAAYRALRLKSYQDAPFAFSESYEDEKHKTEAYFAEEIKTQGDPPECFVSGAFDAANTLIGFVKFRRDLRSKARHKSMLHAMYVDPRFRQQGAGRALVLDTLARARRLNGLEQIHLWVLHADSSVAGFYKKCGFESQGTLVKKDLKIGDTYIDAEYMVLYFT